MSPFNRVRVVPVLVLTFLLSFLAAAPGFADCHRCHPDAQSLTIVVNASPHQVFQAIKQSRYQEPERRKVIESDSSSAILEESFKNLPIIGDAMCRYKEIEVDNQRIDYQILSSDKFKQFIGAWELEPINNGTATRLKLSSYVEAHLKVPFWKQISAMGTKKDIRRRLNNIKQSVEGRKMSDSNLFKL